MTDEIAAITGNDGKKLSDVADSIEKLTEGKYKNAEDLAKAHKDLEKKLGEISEEVRQSREFATIVQPILDEVRNDPEIFDKLDKKLREKNNPDNKNKDEKDEKKTDTKEANTEVRDKMSDLIVARFEERHNFSELSKEDQTKLRNEIGREILEMTGKRLADIDLRNQEALLEKAYKLINTNEKSNTSNETDDNNNDGAISSIKSSGLKGEKTLSSEEATIASGLGLTREQYLAGKKK